MRARWFARAPVLAIAFGFILLSIDAHEARAFWTRDGVPACSRAGDQVTPASIRDGSGGTIVVWSDGRGPSYDIYAQRLNARGRALWTAGGVPVCAASGDQTNPRVIPDGSGGAIVVWQDTRGGELDVYAQRLHADGHPAWLQDGVAVCTAPRDQFFPALAGDGSGGVIVAWQDSRAMDSLRDIYVQRMDAGGFRQWALDGIALGSTRGTRPAIVEDSAGGAIVAWEDSLSQSESDIHAQRVDSLGQWMWTSGAIAVTTATGTQGPPQITRSGDGMTIAWEDHRNADAGIYAQRLDLGGSPGWTTDGILLSSPLAAARKPALTSGGPGEAIVVWEDDRGVGAPDLYAQRVDSLGSVLWQVDGQEVNVSATSHQLAPTIDSDGQGGAMIAWYDFTPQVGTDIRAQHVNAQGQILWGTLGSDVCIAPDNQSLPVILSSGQDQAIVAWQDHRNGSDSDIYVERVLANGFTIEVPVASLFKEPYPNPFNPTVTLEYGVPAPSRVSIRIYDASGRLVRSLLDEGVPPGIQAAVWDGKDDHGKPAASGMYIAEFRAPSLKQSRKLMLVR